MAKHTAIITKASHDLIEANADRRMQPMEQTKDGMYVARFDDDVWEALNRLSPNIDEAIKLACTRGYGNA